MKLFRLLHRLTRHLPDDERASRVHEELLRLRPQADASSGMRVTVQCVQDVYYLALFSHLAHALRKRAPLQADLFVPRSLEAATGVGWKPSLLRSFPLGRLQSNQWIRMYAPVTGRVGYRSSSLRHPLGDLVDAWRSWRVWRGLRTTRELEAVSVDGVQCGDLVIDSYLRFRPSPRIRLDDRFLLSVLWQAHRDVRGAKRYFRSARPALYLTSYTTYVQHGIAARVALQEGVRVVSFGNLQEFGKLLSLDDSFHTRNVLHYRRAFDQLADPQPLLQQAQRQLETRLSGGIDSATSYMASSAYRETTQDVPDTRGAVVVFLHDFYDSAHVYADLVFPDFWEWICFTIETLRAAGIRFLVKPHPNQIALSDTVIGELRQKYPELELIASGVTNRQLVDAGMACAVTVYGTVAHEMAYLGVPSIACARHPHVAFDFCRTARDREEYAALLRNALQPGLSASAMREQALQFYVMHNLNLPTAERDLRDALVKQWKQCHGAQTSPTELVEGFGRMAAMPGLHAFLDNLLPAADGEGGQIMSTLSQQMSYSYAAHPSFRFGQPALPLDSRALDAFSRAYAEVRDHGSTMPKATIAMQVERCEQTLLQVFSALSSGVSDPLELRFITELRAQCQRLLREEIGHFTTPVSATLGQPPEGDDRFERLRRDRYYFSTVPLAAVEQIMEVGAAEIASFRERARQGRLTREDLSTNSGPVVRQIVQILNREFDQGGTLDAMSRYVGFPVAVGGLAVELSVQQATWWVNTLTGLARPPHTLYAHLDEGIFPPKSIVYLTKVDPANGATACYPRIYEDLALNPLQEIVGRIIGCVGNAPDSPLQDYYRKRYHQPFGSEPVRRHFMRLPEALRFNSHLGWDVMPDSELEASLVAREQSMTGGPGTCIVFDGARLFHRGGLVRSGERIALQVVFGRKPTLRSRVIGKIKRAVA